MILVFLKKAWSWLKRNWKWILFPIGILMFVGGILVAVMSGRDDDSEPEDFGEPGKKLADEIVKAAEERDRRLEELRFKNHERLEQLDEDQRKELEELKDKPLEEVVSWFDSL